jgi:hypothetical protein
MPGNANGRIDVDPEDIEQIQRLADIIGSVVGATVPVDKLQQAAREFVRPRLTEPTKLGAVVVDRDGVLWTQYAIENIAERWISEEGRPRTFEKIDAVEVKSEGVA